MTEKSLNDFFIQTFISDVYSLIQCERIYSRLMSSFLCCPLISCQYDSGHMKVVIRFDLRRVLVSMPYVLPGAVAGLHARSPPGQAQLWLLWDRLLITQSAFLPLAQSQAAVLWVGVSTRKLCAYPDLSRAACCCRIAMIWLK